MSIQIIASLENVKVLKTELINITDDGAITEEEKPKLKYIVDRLAKISKEAQELKLWTQKNLK